MEVWLDERADAYSFKAYDFLVELGYSAYDIDEDGQLISFDIASCEREGFRNLIFKK